MKSILLAETTLLAALVWTAALVVRNEPFHGASAMLVGVGMLATATVSTIGMVVVGGRWAHRLALGSLGMTVVLAVVQEIDLMWTVGTITSAVALVALLSPTVTSSIRKLPSASGPPPTAIAPPLLLLITPALLGFVAGDAVRWALLLIGLSAPIAAVLYSRVIPGGLISIRVLWPVMTFALTPLLGWVAGAAAGAMALAVGITAWDSSVKASYHPLREVGTTFPIPAELTPQEILDAAGIDEKGRRK